MAQVVILPKLGFNMSEGVLVKWYKKEGDTIKKGQPLFSVETDKTTIDIEATCDGVVRALLAQEGDKLAVTSPIAILGDASEDISSILSDSNAQSVGDTDEESKSKETKRPTDSGEGYDYDIVVIGGGPGGYVAAIKAAQLGKRTAIIEKETFGGTCLNTGCIPTKTLLKSAERFIQAKDMARFGIEGLDPEKISISLQTVQSRKNSIVENLVHGVEGLLRGNGVDIYRGTAEIEGNHTIRIGSKTLKSEYIILATGSVTKTLSIPADPTITVYTSKEILALKEIPPSIVVIGGGVIGIELAYLLACLGSQVTIVEFLDRILPMVDEEITTKVESSLRQMGIQIFTSAQVTEFAKGCVIFTKGSELHEVQTKHVLLAIGRNPDISMIPSERLGISIAKGAVATDDKLRTSVENIYAVGDVNGKAMLAHVASMEGIIAVRNICGETCSMDYEKIPSAIYIQPEIASVGLTEAQARAKYGEVLVGRFPMLANGKAKVEGEEHGLIKVVAEPKYGEILGVHMFCAHATDMIAEAVVSMRLEGTVSEMAAVVHPHPTLSEAVLEAFDACEGKPIHYL